RIVWCLMSDLLLHLCSRYSVSVRFMFVRRFVYMDLFFFFLLLRSDPRSTLFPYTTLFRSHVLLAEDDPRLCECGGDDLQKRSSPDRKSTRLNSSHRTISYAVFCLKKKKNNRHTLHTYYIRPPSPLRIQLRHIILT